MYMRNFTLCGFLHFKFRSKQATNPHNSNDLTTGMTFVYTLNFKTYVENDGKHKLKYGNYSNSSDQVFIPCMNHIILKKKFHIYICCDLLSFNDDTQNNFAHSFSRCILFSHCGLFRRFTKVFVILLVFPFAAEDEQNSDSESCGKALIVLSWVLVVITMPFSLFVCFKVNVQSLIRSI